MLRIAKIAIPVFVIIAILIATLAPQKPKDVEALAAEQAFAHLQKRMVSPTSTTLIGQRLVERAGSEYFFHFLVDTRNEYNAVIRASYCVVIEFNDADSGYYYNKANSVLLCGNPPDKGEVAQAKVQNGWGQPRAKDIQPSQALGQ